MPLVFSDDGVLVRSLRWDGTAWHRPSGDAQPNNVYRRMHDLGVTHIRINIWWGSISTPGSDMGWRRYDYVVNEATQRGFKVYLTLTGAADPLFGGFDCPPTGCPPRMSGMRPRAHHYAAFVDAAVRRYTPMGVKAFALWNEPNLERFLSAGGLPPSPTAAQRKRDARARAELYRKLYLAGYAAAKRAAPSATVLTGEFSEQAFRAFFSRFVRSSRLDAADRARYRRGRGVRTDGVAFHPYQHLRHPDNPNRRVDDFGVGRLNEINTFVSQAWRLRTRSRPRRRLLATRGDDRPQLFATEFGYLNRRLLVALGGVQPDDSNLTHPDTAKLEGEREELWKAALAKGLADPTVRSWSIYQPSESKPQTTYGSSEACLSDPARFTSYRTQPFDVGLLDNDSGAVSGLRNYEFHVGMKRSCVDYQGSATPRKDEQARSAYCGIHSWTRARGYPYRAVAACP
jgi:hypothetical protein